MEREPALVWRRPAVLWAICALVPSLGLPALILSGEGGMGQLTLIAASIGLATVMLSLMMASALGRAPRSRREIMIHTLWICAAAALLAPVAFQILLTAMEGIDAPNGPVGLSAFLPLAMWPLGLFVGLPFGLFAGFLVSHLAFRREAPDRDVVTLTHATDPALAPREMESDPTVF